MRLTRIAVVLALVAAALPAFAKDKEAQFKSVEAKHFTRTEGVELARVPLDSDSVLINRRRYILHPRGVKFTSASVAAWTSVNARE